MTAGQTVPTGQGRGILVHADAGNNPPLAYILRSAQAEAGQCAINIAPLHRTAHHQLVAAPAVIGAIAVAGESSTKIRRSKGGDLVSHPQLLGGSVKSLQALAQLT